MFRLTSSLVACAEMTCFSGINEGPASGDGEREARKGNDCLDAGSGEEGGVSMAGASAPLVRNSGKRKSV